MLSVHVEAILVHGMVVYRFLRTLESHLLLRNISLLADSSEKEITYF